MHNQLLCGSFPELFSFFLSTCSECQENFRTLLNHRAEVIQGLPCCYHSWLLWLNHPKRLCWKISLVPGSGAIPQVCSLLDGLLQEQFAGGADCSPSLRSDVIRVKTLGRVRLKTWFTFGDMRGRLSLEFIHVLSVVRRKSHQGPLSPAGSRQLSEV